MGWFDNMMRGLSGRKRSVPTPSAADSRLEWTSSVAPRAGAMRKAAPTSSFPRFQFTAGDHVDSRQADRFLSIRVKLRQAFTPSQPITDRKMFAGRSQTLAHLIRAIEDQRVHTVIYGERGIGKTSMLLVLAEAAKEARYQVVYLSCGAGSNFEEMIRSITHDIPLLYHGGYGPTSAEAESGKTMADLLPPGPITVRSAADLLTKIVGTRILIILDEFDRVESTVFRHAVAELLKTLSDQAARVQIVIAGVAANLTELIENVPSIQRNIYALQVPKMNASEVTQLVNNGETASGLSFDDGAITAIVSRSMGFPFLASLLSHRSGMLAIDADRTLVTANDVDHATADAVMELEGRISRRSQLQIRDCVDSGLLGILGPMAGAALYSGGRFALDDVEGFQAGGEAKARAAVDELANHGALIAAVEDEFGRTYGFLEDTVPPYLWLLSAQQRFAIAPLKPVSAAG